MIRLRLDRLIRDERHHQRSIGSGADPYAWPGQGDKGLRRKRQG